MLACLGHQLVSCQILAHSGQRSHLCELDPASLGRQLASCQLLAHSGQGFHLCELGQASPDRQLASCQLLAHSGQWFHLCELGPVSLDQQLARASYWRTLASGYRLEGLPSWSLWIVLDELGLSPVPCHLVASGYCLLSSTGLSSAPLKTDLKETNYPSIVTLFQVWIEVDWWGPMASTLSS